MKIHCTLSRTFRGRAAAPRSIPALSKSLGQTQPITLHPQAIWFGFRPINLISFTITSRPVITSAGTQLSSVANAPQQEELRYSNIINEVHFVGLIDEPVQCKYTNSGRPLAWTTLEIRHGDSCERTRLELVFWDELAETAAQHVKTNDTLYVSGRLVSQTSAIKDDKPLKLYKVIANRLNFIASPKNTPLPDVYQKAVVNMHTFQREESPVKSSSSGKETGEDVVMLQSLWEELFASPDDWWDNRKDKRYKEEPDFWHKNNGTKLWINNPSNPAWIKSVLLTWDMRRKASRQR